MGLHSSEQETFTPLSFCLFQFVLTQDLHEVVHEVGAAYLAQGSVSAVTYMAFGKRQYSSNQGCQIINSFNRD